MNKTIYINENYKLLKATSNIVEGGLARNIAIMSWLQNNINGLKEIKLFNNRIINLFIVFFILLTERKSKIIFQYVTVGVPLFNGTIIGKVLRQAFIISVSRSSKFNNLIFDVSDLKYEQSIDLDIEPYKRSLMKDFENKFFRLNLKFIFASYAMQEYACKKYKISKENTEVIINGGNIPRCKSLYTHCINLHKINYVYAGTLNNGRSIEEMIKQFPNRNEVHLYLMGSGGEWIKDVIKGRNITYLGAYPEEKAHEIVAMCDIGLIPYDNTKKYFNIAFPTKLSFYVTAGIPFLSTPVDEVIRINNIYQFGFIEEITNWEILIKKLCKKTIENEKNKIINNNGDFEWGNVISKSRFLKIENNISR